MTGDNARGLYKFLRLSEASAVSHLKVASA